MKETEKDCLAAGAPGVAPAVSPLLKGETLRVLVPQLCKIATTFAHFHEKNQNIKKQLQNTIQTAAKQNAFYLRESIK